jgi:hypothetical protein
MMSVTLFLRFNSVNRNHRQNDVMSEVRYGRGKWNKFIVSFIFFNDLVSPKNNKI